MGVLACDRDGCKNIMCDRLSYRFGYLCWECFEELCRSNLDVEVFMQTEVGSIPQSKDRYEEYDQEFPFLELTKNEVESDIEL